MADKRDETIELLRSIDNNTNLNTKEISGKLDAISKQLDDIHSVLTEIFNARARDTG